MSAWEEMVQDTQLIRSNVALGEPIYAKGKAIFGKGKPNGREMKMLNQTSHLCLQLFGKNLMREGDLCRFFRVPQYRVKTK